MLANLKVHENSRGFSKRETVGTGLGARGNTGDQGDGLESSRVWARSKQWHRVIVNCQKAVGADNDAPKNSLQLVPFGFLSAGYPSARIFAFSPEQPEDERTLTRSLSLSQKKEKIESATLRKRPDGDWLLSRSLGRRGGAAAAAAAFVVP